MAGLILVLAPVVLAVIWVVATFNRLPAGTEEVWFYLHGRLMGDPVSRSARSWFFHSR